ncbi:MAG: RsmE family RNA methyltransferase [Acidimicrobiales bacterium]
MIGPAAAAAAAHAFVADLEQPVLAGVDRHHLERVLRLRAGELLTVADGAGRWRAVRFGALLEPDGPIVEDPSPGRSVAVAVALLKGDRLESAVAKLVEVGVDAVLLFPAARSVVRWDDGKRDRHLERMARVAREAAMQSRRSRLTELRWFDSTAAVAATPGAVRADRGGEPLTVCAPTVVMIGPEGGWSDEERRLAVPVVSLGAHVLRADTAATVAGWSLTARRDLGE